MTVRYLNWNRETIDELDTSDFKRPGDEMRRLRAEYAMAGMPGAYWSSRPCANWKD